MDDPKLTPEEQLTFFGHARHFRLSDPDLDDGLEYMRDPIFVNQYARDYHGLELED